MTVRPLGPHLPVFTVSGDAVADAEPGGRDGNRGRMSTTDRRSPSIWLLCAGFVVLAFSAAGTLAGAGITARRRAQAAADLGALAGARFVVEDEAAGCTRAAGIVEANGAGWPVAGSTAWT